VTPGPYFHDPSRDTSTCRTCGRPAPPGTIRCSLCCITYDGAGWVPATENRELRQQLREQRRLEFFARKKAERESRSSQEHQRSTGGGGNKWKPKAPK
jgi:hypothetical protein